MDLDIQEEEREALLSIYEGDECFKQLTPTVFQYKYGENNDTKSFLLQIEWGETYPTDKPIINMNTFYNKHIIQSLKNKVVNMVSDEAEQYLGMSMTYSLFEFVKEKFDEIIEEQPENINEINGVENLDISDAQEIQEIKKKVPKKEQLTKAQKRRQWDKIGDRGEKPRGWNWVDIVKHLSQTGSKESSDPTTN